MPATWFISALSLLLCHLPLAGFAQAAEEENPIPEELLDDEHLREEMGVNPFTTPSIGRIFEDLRRLRPLPYEEMKRPLPEQPPQDRIQLALSMGVLMGNGFFAVEAEQFFDLEPVGRALLNHGKVLGSGSRISSHMKSVLEKGAGGHWSDLKEELVRTQRDVEREMVLIRDVDVANLIALGGWLRALEIACASSLNPYDPAKAATLAKPQVVEYFVLNLETMEPRVKSNPVVSRILERLVALQEEVDLPDGEILSEEEVRRIHQSIEVLVDEIAGGERLIKSLPGITDSPAPGAPTRTPAATGGVVSGEVPE